MPVGYLQPSRRAMVGQANRNLATQRALKPLDEQGERSNDWRKGLMA